MLWINCSKNAIKYYLGLFVTSVLSKSKRRKKYQRNNAALVENLMDKLMFLGILPTTILAMIGEELFVVVFGARWLKAGATHKYWHLGYFFGLSRHR